MRLSRADLVDLLPKTAGLDAASEHRFRQLAERLASQIHQDFHRQLQALKVAYADFDPDLDDHRLRRLSEAERDQRLDEFFSKMVWLLQRANYIRLDRHDVDEACRLVSKWGINMEVDYDVFERWEIFARGDVVVRRPLRHWRKGWRTEMVEVPIYSRLVIILKLRPDRFKDQRIDTRDIFLKMFKDIPQMDLEMLLPGAKVRFSSFDRGKLGFSLVTGLVLAFWNVLKITLFPLIGLGATVVSPGPTALWWGITAGTLGYGWRSFYSYNWTQTRYHLTLTRNLYYQNLDNNAGVLFRLVDEAEEQECREALLGYWFLWQEAPATGWCKQDLDRRIEKFLLDQTGISCDFEVKDALAKLLRLGLVQETQPGQFRALPLEEALNKLDQRWREELIRQPLDAAAEPSTGPVKSASEG